MLKILLVCSDNSALSGLSTALSTRSDIELATSASGQKALEILSKQAVDLVVADEDLGDMTALELSRRLLKINPMINCAAVSSLSAEEFHEASEGLGIMAKLPKQPSATDADELINNLKQIMGLLA